MARRVFFSFHYQNDIWRVNQIRKSGEFTDVEGTDTFYDNSLWEATKKRGDEALKKLIGDGLWNSSVTAVLAGAETWTRKWVRYELIKSFERGNGLMTLWLDQVKDTRGLTSTRGKDPLGQLYFRRNTGGSTATTFYHDGKDWRTYETIKTNALPKNAQNVKEGRLSDFAIQRTWYASNAKEFAVWADEAARAAGR